MKNTNNLIKEYVDETIAGEKIIQQAKTKINQ